MTLSITTAIQRYNGTGANTPLNTIFPFFVSSDIIVTQKVTATDIDTILALGVHYTVSGGSGTGAVGLVTPIDGATDFTTGMVWALERSIPLTQSLDYVENDSFPAASHEAGMDRLTMQSQDRSAKLARAMLLSVADVTGSGSYDAEFNNIKNLSTPVNDQDAATRAFVIAQVGTGFATSVSPSGTGDDTALLQSVVDIGGIVFVNPGTYNLDQVTVTMEAHIFMSPDAIFLQRSGTGSTDQAILLFDTGSDYSSVHGGQFDGNYTALNASHTDEVWTAIRVSNGPTHLRFSNLHIRDFMHAGWYCGNCTFSVFETIHVENCGKGCIHQQADNGLIENVTFQDITNHNKAIYQHAVEIRDSTDLSISNVRVIDFAPDNTGLEPIPLGIAFERMTRLRVNGITTTGFAGVTKPGLGFVFDTCDLSHIEGLTVDGGYDSGGAIKSCSDTSFDGLNIDLGYNTAGDGIGLRLLGSGLYPAIGSGLTADNARTNSACRNVRVVNSIVMRAELDGFLVQSGGVTLSSCVSVGCNGNGFRIDEGIPNTLFVAAPITVTGHVVLDNCQGLANGSAGLLIETSEDISIRGGTYSNNGQDTGAATNARVGIRVFDGDRISIVDVNASDTQVWSSKADVVSYKPGATVSEAYTVSLSDPAQLNVGQYVTLSDAGGTGVHATARITDIDRDEITVAISGGFTFAETGNTTALTGTFDTVGFTLTGTTAALDTEIEGRTWVLNIADWRQIIRTNSADSGVIGEAFPSDLVTQTLTKVTSDLAPIVSQQIGIRVETTVTELFASGVTGSGNVSALWSVVSAASVASIESSGNERPSIASATALTVPNGIRHALITGTTTITSMTAGFAGRIVVLEFAGILTFTDGSNLKLAGNFVTTADDTIVLVSDGTNWIEIARSVN